MNFSRQRHSTNSLQDLVKEYAALGDEEEAARCWRDLDVTFFGHQLVYTILLEAFETPAKEELLLRLIRRFEASGEVSQVPPFVRLYL